MGDTPICTIDQFGIHKPLLGDCLAYFTSKYTDIHGADTYLGADSQDGEWTGLIAAALDDTNAMCVKAYASFSPATAQGVKLDINVKINNLQRKVPTFSTATMLIVGQVGGPIPAGIVKDTNGIFWALDLNLTIPQAGQLFCGATCLSPGAISAGIGTITNIQNPNPYWQSATNTTNAVPGAPVENDAALRSRQAISTTQPAQSVTDNIVAEIVAVPGVVRVMPYENTSSTTDVNAVPGHCLAMIVDGGDPTDIATAIKRAKSGGSGTFGTTTIVLIDDYGVPIPINFYYVTEPLIRWGATIHPLNGFSLGTLPLIQQAVSDWTNSLGIWCNAEGSGNGIELTRSTAAFYLQYSIQAAAAMLKADLASGDANAIAADIALISTLQNASTTYKVTINTITAARDSDALAAVDIPIAFNEAPLCTPASVTLTVI